VNHKSREKVSAIKIIAKKAGS